MIFPLKAFAKMVVLQSQELYDTASPAAHPAPRETVLK